VCVWTSCPGLHTKARQLWAETAPCWSQFRRSNHCASEPCDATSHCLIVKYHKAVVSSLQLPAAVTAAAAVPLTWNTAAMLAGGEEMLQRASLRRLLCRCSCHGCQCFGHSGFELRLASLIKVWTDQKRAKSTCLNHTRAPGHLPTPSHAPVLAPRVVRIDPLRFLAGWRRRRLNQALSVLSLSLGFFDVCVVLLTRYSFRLCYFYVICVLCLVVVLVRLSVTQYHCKWLTGKARLRNDL